MIESLHLLLALISAVAILVATCEGGIRAVRNSKWNNNSLRTLIAVVITLSLTTIFGIVLVISGKHPKEWLHLLYVALAIGLIPFADNAAIPLLSNRRKGLYRFAGGITCILVLTRLYVTGHH
jgi:hypothetical protein